MKFQLANQCKKNGRLRVGENEKVKKWSCVVPESINTSPTEGHWKFLQGGGFKTRSYFLGGGGWVGAK